MKAVRFAVPLFVLATIAMAPRALALVRCADADLVLHNGKIVTMNDQRAVVDAMAVRNGVIVSVGRYADVHKCAGKATKAVDLGGKIVLPGFIDVHTHALEWAKGVVRGELDLTYPRVYSVDEIVSQVRNRAQQSAAGEWIVGFGWDDAKLTERRYVTRRDLDQATPQHPVYLVHVSGHLA
ncbi:MAG: amidohydrolase family protein, partial [Gammaproteobacteria bacterium]